jgi:16S rRNA (adenine1518-N6/adenine1519-N6)-dimethyltransferase
MNLTNPATLISLLKKYGLYTQKSLGQHFLTDQTVLDQALQAANLSIHDTVLEIGAGTGVLTRQLAQQAGQVLAFEIDEHLTHLLAETVGEYANVSLHFQDFLTFDLSQLPSSYKLVANLPYHVGSHIIDQLLKATYPPQSITVLLQRQVAEKMVARPPHATYLSNFIQTYGEARIVKLVKPGAFFPPPQVDSALVHIARSEGSSPPAFSFSRFLHRGFAHPRKMLNKAFTKEELAVANIEPTLRPENLTLDDWSRLYQIGQQG